MPSDVVMPMAGEIEKRKKVRVISPGIILHQIKQKNISYYQLNFFKKIKLTKNKSQLTKNNKNLQ